MIDSLQVIKIEPNKPTGILVKTHGSTKVLKIRYNDHILIRHKVINTKELKIGDKILAYGFDFVPKAMYNSRDRRVKTNSQSQGDRLK